MKKWLLMVLVFGAALIVMQPGQASIAQGPMLEPVASIGARGTLTTLQWSPDSTQVATSALDGIRVYDRELEDVVYLNGVAGLLQPLDWSSDGQLIAAASMRQFTIPPDSFANNTNRFLCGMLKTRHHYTNFSFQPNVSR